LKPDVERCFEYMSHALGLLHYEVPSLTSHHASDYTLTEERMNDVVDTVAHALIGGGYETTDLSDGGAPNNVEKETRASFAKPKKKTKNKKKVTTAGAERSTRKHARSSGDL
jgi:hypothetical protein